MRSRLSILVAAFASCAVLQPAPAYAGKTKAGSASTKRPKASGQRGRSKSPEKSNFHVTFKPPPLPPRSSMSVQDKTRPVSVFLSRAPLEGDGLSPGKRWSTETRGKEQASAERRWSTEAQGRRSTSGKLRNEQHAYGKAERRPRRK